MKLTVLDIQTDLRTSSPVIYARTSIKDYLKLVGEHFYEFSIQRRREKFTAYTQMREDIVAGTLLPTITLAVPLPATQYIRTACDCQDQGVVAAALIAKSPLNILDGLQRTFILHELNSSGHQFKDGQSVHLEIRVESDIRQLIYRIIVLNAGQKPMSMRHQIEILSLSLRDVLTREIPGLELVPEADAGRRTKARKFALDRISSAYHAFIIKSPEIEKQNLVAQRLSEQSVLEQEMDQFGEQFLQFVEYFKLFCQIDDAVDGLPPDGDGVPSATNWLGGENTINAFFAAVSDFGVDDDRKQRIKTAISRLIREINEKNSSSPLGLPVFQAIASGFPARKTNIGYATRKLILNVFSEYFRKEGAVPLSEFWAKEAE